MMKASTSRIAGDSLLDRLVARVELLYTNAQAALPAERGKLYALYREAHLALRAHKLFMDEQDARLAKPERALAS